MSKDLSTTTPGGSLAVAHAQTDRMARFKAMSAELEAVTDERCPRPIPRFMLSLPWTSPDDMVSERIIAQLLSADDPYAATDAGSTVSGKDLVGRKVTIHDLRVQPSDKPGGWGAYLLCDVTVDDDDNNRLAMTIGAKQAVAIIAYAYQAGDFPLVGTPTVVTTTGEGNTVLGFIVEPAF